MTREYWLWGWPRMGLTGVLMGTSVCCVGCGMDRGVTTVAFDGTPFPEQEPDWPFDCENCPVCALESQLLAPQGKDTTDRLTERMLAIRRLMRST